MKMPVFFFVALCMLAVGVLALRDAIIDYHIAKWGKDVRVSVVPGSTVCKSKTSTTDVMYRGKKYHLTVFSDMCYQVKNGEIKTFECRYSGKYDKLKMVHGREYFVLIMMIVVFGFIIFLVVKEYISIKRQHSISENQANPGSVP